MENKKVISQIITTNYRNLANESDVSLDCLNILVGSNGSGKSNFVAILEFLKDCLLPSPELDSRGITAFQDALSKLRFNILDASLKKPAKVTFKFKFPHLHPAGDITFSLDLFVDKRVSIDAEVLQQTKPIQGAIEPFIYYKSHDRQSGSGVVSINKRRQKGSQFKSFQVPVDELSLLTIPKLLTEEGIFSAQEVPLYKIYTDLRENVKKWQFYNSNDMDLAKIRSASPKLGLSDSILSKSADNLPTVLDNIINHTTYGLDFDERINHAMREILPTSRSLSENNVFT